MVWVENWDLLGLGFNPSWFMRRSLILWVGSICLWQFLFPKCGAWWSRLVFRSHISIFPYISIWPGIKDWIFWFGLELGMEARSGIAVIFPSARSLSGQNVIYIIIIFILLIIYLYFYLYYYYYIYIIGSSLLFPWCKLWFCAFSVIEKLHQIETRF